VALCHLQESGWGKKERKRKKMKRDESAAADDALALGERGRTRDVMIVNAGQGEAFLLPRPANGIALVAIKTARVVNKHHIIKSTATSMCAVMRSCVNEGGRVPA
jgi:hypothetical protein